MMVAACKRYDLTQEKPSMDFADRLGYTSQQPRVEKLSQDKA